MRDRVEELEEEYDALSCALSEMADYGRYWEFQPELQEQAYGLREGMKAIRAEIDAILGRPVGETPLSEA